MVYSIRNDSPISIIQHVPNAAKLFNIILNTPVMFFNVKWDLLMHDVHVTNGMKVNYFIINQNYNDI